MSADCSLKSRSVSALMSKGRTHSTADCLRKGTDPHFSRTERNTFRVVTRRRPDRGQLPKHSLNQLRIPATALTIQMDSCPNPQPGKKWFLCIVAMLSEVSFVPITSNRHGRNINRARFLKRNSSGSKTVPFAKQLRSRPEQVLTLSLTARCGGTPSTGTSLMRQMDSTSSEGGPSLFVTNRETSS